MAADNLVYFPLSIAVKVVIGLRPTPKTASDTFEYKTDDCLCKA